MAPRGRKRNRATSITEACKDVIVNSPEQDNHNEPDESDEPHSSENAEHKEEELWESFKEEHHEAIEQLPLSLHRTFRLIQELDSQAQVHQQELQAMLRLYVKCRQHLSSATHDTKPVTASSTETHLDVVKRTASDGAGWPEQPSQQNSRQLITRLVTLLEEWVRTADEKLSLAQAAYNSIDRHVRILDLAISEQEKIVSISNAANSSLDVLPAPPSTDPPKQRLHFVSNNKTLRASKRKAVDSPARDGATRKVSKRTESGPPAFSANATPHARSQNTMDMAILPNEPVYCYCNQVSHGSMIACDNKDCAREWVKCYFAFNLCINSSLLPNQFHYACVGLLEAPTSRKSWYCPDCSDALGRNNRRKR